MSKFAIAGLACILASTATISRADEEAPRTFRLQRQTPHGVEEKFVSEKEYNQFNKDSEERERRHAASGPRVIGPYVPGDVVYSQPSPYRPAAEYRPAAPAAPIPVSPLAPCQPGTFSVVSDGSRSILINTITSSSWLLVIDEQGSHWQEITFPAPATSAQQPPVYQAPYAPQPAPYAPQPAPYTPGPATPEMKRAPMAPTPVEPQAAASTLSPSDVQRLEEAYIERGQTIDTLHSQMHSLRDQAKEAAMALEKLDKMFVKKLNEKNKEIAELKEKLEEANADEVQPQVDAAERTKGD